MKSYLKLLSDVLIDGEDHDDRTGVGTRSVFGHQWRHDMRTGFPLLTTKKVPLRWVFEELRWFLSGSTDAWDLQENGVDIWDEWATREQCEKFGRKPGELGPIYGELWRRFDTGCRGGDTDQIENLLKGIESTPFSRRHIVTGWHPEDCNKVALPPCHTLWQIKVHPNRNMSLHLYARSIDVFLGLPFNIASYAILLNMIAFVTGYHARDLIISFGDLHLYSNHVEQAKEQLARTPFDLPGFGVRRDPKGNSPLNTLLAFRWEDFHLMGHKHHPKIEAPVAI